jgi:hypothetical protein
VLCHEMTILCRRLARPEFDRVFLFAVVSPRRLPSSPNSYYLVGSENAIRLCSCGVPIIESGLEQAVSRAPSRAVELEAELELLELRRRSYLRR